MSEVPTLVAGEGGAALVASASRPGVAALACEGIDERARVPSGLPVYPPAAIPDDLDVAAVALLPAEASTVAAVRAWAERRGLPVEDAATGDLEVSRPVVAVSSPSTGSGKTAVTRRVVRALRASGVAVAVARHPLPALLAWDRFAAGVVRSPAELAAARPLTEREELAPVVGTGAPVVTGLDALGIARAAEREAGDGVIVWDGGGAARPWLAPTVHIVVIDLLRPPEPAAMEHVASADAVVLAKADSAPPASVREVEARVRSWNPRAAVVLADMAVGVAPTGVLADRAVVCVEDWSALVLGGLRGGAGTVAARRFRCGLVDPRPFAVGAVAQALDANAHIGPVIPSIGRTAREQDDLAASVRATPGEVVLWASNADPATVVPDETRPIVRAYGELTEVSGASLQEVLAPVLPGAG